MRDSIGPYVRIRNWKPGDYYRPVGLPAGKLKKLFQRARIPRSHRTELAGGCRRFDDYLGSLISRFPRICPSWTIPENSGF